MHTHECVSVCILSETRQILKINLQKLAKKHAHA